MNWQSLNTIWKPDTFFVNGKKSKMHKITVPNKFLRITPDGHVSYSQRLTIHARCRMHLLKFPLDSQICPLWISSYGYASRYVNLVWDEFELEFSGLSKPELWRFRAEPSRAGALQFSSWNRADKKEKFWPCHPNFPILCIYYYDYNQFISISWSSI